MLVSALSLQLVGGPHLPALAGMDTVYHLHLSPQPTTGFSRVTLCTATGANLQLGSPIVSDIPPAFPECLCPPSKLVFKMAATLISSGSGRGRLQSQPAQCSESSRPSQTCLRMKIRSREVKKFVLKSTAYRGKLGFELRPFLPHTGLWFPEVVRAATENTGYR